MFSVSLFIGDRSKTDKGGSCREIKVGEAGVPLQWRQIVQSVQPKSNMVWNKWESSLKSISTKNKPEPRNSIVNALYSSAEIFESVARSLFTTQADQAQN